MGWKLGRVRQVNARYVEQDEVIRSLADRIQANGSGTKAPKQLPNSQNRSTVWDAKPLKSWSGRRNRTPDIQPGKLTLCLRNQQVSSQTGLNAIS